MNHHYGLGIDDKLATKTGTQVEYFLQDHLGSTVGLSDSTGTVSSTASYDSFGNQTGSLPTRYGFTGREYDATAGLNYYRARMYDPQIGRFLSEDPIGFFGGDVNLYGYVSNNPTSNIDPMGTSLIRRIGRIVKSLKPNKLGRPLESLDEAAQLGDQGVDILASNRQNAKAIATKMDPQGRPPVHDPAHGSAHEGYRPHYHAYGRPKGKGHIFYSTIAPILAPSIVSVSENPCVTTPQFLSAIFWDGASLLDPIGLTDLIEGYTGLDGGRGGFAGLADVAADMVSPLVPIPRVTDYF